MAEIAGAQYPIAAISLAAIGTVGIDGSVGPAATTGSITVQVLIDPGRPAQRWSVAIDQVDGEAQMTVMSVRSGRCERR